MDRALLIVAAQGEASTKDTVRSELALRLTDEQIAAIRLRHQRRTKKIVECAQIDLGDISPADGSDSSNASMVAPVRARS
jgi:hypothetical protein